jgi:methionyl-tRNA formyltransferase
LRDADALSAFAALDADIAVVAAYGLILPQAVLDAPRLGCLNIHASLLPRWRGAAPIHRAILAGDAETGVCIMQMEAGLDTGPVRAEARVAVNGKSVGALTGELAEVGSRLLIDVLADLEAYPPIPQPEEGVTYASKVAKEELKLDFSEPAEQVLRQVQAFNPPGAWFEFAGERIRVLRCEAAGAIRAEAGMVTDGALTIACSTGAVRPTTIQRAGRAPMTSAELLRGFPIPAGTRL